jgi:hypothetical protein
MTSYVTRLPGARVEVTNRAPSSAYRHGRLSHFGPGFYGIGSYQSFGLVMLNHDDANTYPYTAALASTVRSTELVLARHSNPTLEPR